MKDVSNNDARGSCHTGNPSTETPKGSSRRKLLGQIGATFAAGMLVRDASASGQSSNSGFGGAGASNVGAPGGVNNLRVLSLLHCAAARRSTSHKFLSRHTLPTAMRRATPTSPAPTPKDCCKTVFAGSICMLTRLSKPR